MALRREGCVEMGENFIDLEEMKRRALHWCREIAPRRSRMFHRSLWLEGLPASRSASCANWISIPAGGWSFGRPTTSSQSPKVGENAICRTFGSFASGVLMMRGPSCGYADKYRNPNFEDVAGRSCFVRQLKCSVNYDASPHSLPTTSSPVNETL